MWGQGTFWGRFLRYYAMIVAKMVCYLFARGGKAHIWGSFFPYLILLLSPYFFTRDRYDIDSFTLPNIMDSWDTYTQPQFLGGNGVLGGNKKNFEGAAPYVTLLCIS